MEGIHEPEEEYRVSLPEFEGPLDLLLHLVKRHELDIFNIPISFITEKYLEYLGLMQQLNLDVAGEYLLMAATLAHIKSRELLPQLSGEEEEEDGEEGMDPKEELIRRLLEYQKYKDVAEQLGNRPMLGRRIFRRGSEMEPVEPEEQQPFAEVSIFALVSALAEVLKRTHVHLVHDVVVDRISISDRINNIVDMLDSQETLRFEECFKLDGSMAQIRHEVVVTFLAILEMARLHMIRLVQPEPAGQIYIVKTERVSAVDTTVEKDYQ
jgi:segregation and condensation protein A